MNRSKGKRTKQLAEADAAVALEMQEVVVPGDPPLDLRTPNGQAVPLWTLRDS